MEVHKNNGSKPKVLIVEDDIIISSDIKKYLKSTGYDVIACVRQGYVGVKIARERKPDIVLLDIMLEGYMNGIEAAEIISNELKIPVIFLTALNDDETFLSAADTCPYAFISKPFIHEQINKAIDSALNSVKK